MTGLRISHRELEPKYQQFLFKARTKQAKMHELFKKLNSAYRILRYLNILHFSSWTMMVSHWMILEHFDSEHADQTAPRELSDLGVDCLQIHSLKY